MLMHVSFAVFNGNEKRSTRDKRPDERRRKARI